MNKHTKDSLQDIKEKVDGNNYYLPKSLFDRHHFGEVRLETKMAYVAILDTLLKKPIFDKKGNALLKNDNPEIINTLKTLTNKEVDTKKMQKYYQELEDAKLLVIDKQDVYVMEVE